MISFLGFAFCLLFLWSPGWSPQWISASASHAVIELTCERRFADGNHNYSGQSAGVACAALQGIINDLWVTVGLITSGSGLDGFNLVSRGK